MCFSAEADVTVGLLILPVAVASLREVRHVREVPFATLPLLFALHQFVEALVWAGTEGQVSAEVQHAAALTYLIYALPVLPTLVPVSVLLLEPRGARQRVAPFAVLGAMVSAYLAWALLTEPVGVIVHPHALEYDTAVPQGNLVGVLYIVAVIGPFVLSGYRSIATFGWLNLVGLTVVAFLYFEAFVSVWCVFAACASVLVLVHMVRRRRLSEAHRMHGEPTRA
jgi:hypothetical protein